MRHSCRPRAGGILTVVVLSFVLPAAIIFAQTSGAVSGCVRDSSRSVVVGATVVFTEQGSGKRLQTQSDEKGCFAAAVAGGSYRLEIRAEGFAPYERQQAVAGATQLDDVILELQPLRNAIVVSATRTPTPTTALGSSVDVIDRTAIEASEATQAIDLLRRVGSLAVMRSGDRGGITSLFMRGGESDYTKILVDGIPVNQPGGIYDVSHLSTDNISRIEVVRGPQSAIFGSDAIAGVVQVFTRPGSGTPEFEYAAEGGSFDTTDQRASLRGAWRKFDFSNSFDRFDTDNIGVNNDYRNASYFGNFGYTPDSRQSLRASLMYSSVKEGTPGATVPGFISFGPDDRMSRLERAAGLAYRVFLGSRVTQHLAYRLYDHDQYFYGAFGSTVLHTRHRFEYHGDVEIPSAGTFSYGIDYDRENATVGADRHLRNNSGFYVQQQIQVARRLNLTAGARLENNTTFGNVATPRVAASFLLSPRTRLRFSAGTGIKEPNFSENFSDNIFFTGNRGLRAERSRSWEAGVEQSLWGDRVTLDLAWFDNRFRNIIELVSLPDFTGHFENIGRSLARGIEFRVSGQYRRARARANYTYLDGHVQESDQLSFPFRTADPLLRRPRHSGDAGVTWSERRWSADWTTRYVGRRADSDFFTFPVPLYSNESYTTSSAAFTYDFPRFVSAYLRFDNLFDRSYQEVLGYQALGRSAAVGVRIRLAAGR
jgi:vitamin B12 transporter